MIDHITLLLSCARFASAIARLCLGPLMPILAISLRFSEDAKPALLSAYSSGYILTQLFGGYVADRLGAMMVISLSVGASALLLLVLTMSGETVVSSNNDEYGNGTDTVIDIWTKTFFCLGMVAGPIFPAGSAAISANVTPKKQAASAAIVDAAAAAGTTVAALTPLLVTQFGGSWQGVYNGTAIMLLVVSIMAGIQALSPIPSPSSVLSSSKNKSTSPATPITENLTTSNSSSENGFPISVHFSQAAIGTCTLSLLLDG